MLPINELFVLLPRHFHFTCIGDDDIITAIHYIKSSGALEPADTRSDIEWTRTALVVNGLVLAHEHCGNSLCEFSKDSV